MSLVKIIFIFVLILAILYGVLQHPQTQKYLPEEVRATTAKISIDQLPLDKLSLNQIPFDQITEKVERLPENQFTNWLKAKLAQSTDEKNRSDGDSKTSEQVSDATQSVSISSEDINESDISSEENIESAESTTKSDSSEGEPQTSETLNTFKNRAAEIGEQTKQVLGASIQPAEDETGKPKPVYQSALESGLYLYCKQVVSDYEKQNN